MSKYVFRQKLLLKDDSVQHKDMAKLWSQDLDGCEVAFEEGQVWAMATDRDNVELNVHRDWCEEVRLSG